MKYQVILTLVLLLSIGGLSYGAPLTLEESITIALRNNLDIKQEEIVLKISGYQERAVLAQFYPTLSAVGTDLYLKNNPIMSRYSGFLLKQPVYTGGRLTNDLKASQQNRNAKLYGFQVTELSIENRVFREYMNCLRYWKFSKAYRDALERAGAHLETVKKDISEGKRGEEDSLRWKVLIDNYKAKLVNSEKDLANSRVRLNTLMNRDICEPIEVIDSHNLRFEYADFMIRQMRYTGEQMLEMYNDYALVFSPAYKRKMTETLIAQYNLLSEQASLRPTVDILSNYNGRSMPIIGAYNTWDTGMYVNFDLYKQQKYENIKISQLQSELSKVKEETYLRDLKSDIRTSYLSNASNNERVSLQRIQEKTSRLYMKEITAKYADGKASNLDVIEGFDSFYQNLITLIDSIYNAFTEFANLYNMIGFSFVYDKPAPNVYWRYKEHGLNVDYDLKNLDDRTFLFTDDPDFEKVKNTFKNNPSLFKTQDKTGQTALHYAIDRGNVKCVEFLLQNGADPNAVNYVDGTPMVRAICFGPPENRLKIAELLVRYGADLNRVSHYHPPLNWAAMKNNLGIVKLLVQAGAKVNIQDEYMKLTPLHFSAFWGNVEMAKFLLENGADPSIVNADGVTALDLAWQFEFKDYIQFFEKAGIK
ncbi:MAG: TolC family protein [Candidatus Xenobiia bacterium LiM19]